MEAGRTAEQLARSLGNHGFTFRSFTLTSAGTWTDEDADWNYKDVPHLNVVHTLVKAIPATIDDEVIATVNVQKMLGVSVPLTLVNYVASDDVQVYYTTFFCFVLIVETRIAPSAGEIATKVDTTYRIGGPKFAMVLFPLMRRVLSKNYEVLMSEDLPMREQRGRLRQRGFTFRSDGRPRTFAETTDVYVDNLVTPSASEKSDERVARADLLDPESSVLVGSWPFGLRLVRGSSGEVLVFDRVCGHEGGNLDEAPQRRDCLTCPWHARRVLPIAKFDLGAPVGTRIRANESIEIEIEPDALFIRTTADRNSR